MCTETLVLQNGRDVEGLPNSGNVLDHKFLLLIQEGEIPGARHNKLIVCGVFF